MRIYMDVCCLNRPFDEQAQGRVLLETDSILSILSRCRNSDWSLLASEMIEIEISKASDVEKRVKVETLYALADKKQQLAITEQVWARAGFFQRHGIKLFDSLHLALAEINRVSVFLTTDDRLIAAANRLEIGIAVANPVTWLMEVTKNE